ncbi:autophagy-related protein 22-like protein [Chytridium lagenaria]|nr:autophagy-related protein 22-like protein [Chytridium lagenaria]
MTEFADVAGDDASNQSNLSLQPITVFISDSNDLDPSAVTPTELKAWYTFGFAAEGFSTLGVGVLIPLILESMASSSGYQTENKMLPCNRTELGYSCVVNVGGTWIDTTSFVFYSTTICTLLQLFVFIGCGALADHGHYRKTFLLAFSIASIGITTLFLTVTTAVTMYTYAAIIYILANLCFCATFVFYNAWIPVMTRNHPEVLAIRAKIFTSHSIDDLSVATDRIGNYISSRGFFWTYTGGLIVLLLGSAIAFVMGDTSRFGLPETYGAQVAVVFSVVWWAAFLYPVLRYLKPRPGPPLPKGEMYFLYSVKKVGSTILKCRRLKNLFIFLIGWFLYSDAFSTLLSVAVLYAQSELRMNTMQLLLLVIIVVIVAGLGCIIWDKFQRAFNISTKRILILQVVLYAFIPFWGIVGFFAPFGIKTVTEIYIMGAWNGFLMGSTQSTCRALFAELVPQGLEVEFFSLYVITDKGSAWIGPLVIAAIDDQTHNKRLGFIFILVMMLLPLFFLSRVNIAEGKREAIEFLKEEQHPSKKKMPPHLMGLKSLKKARA